MRCGIPSSTNRSSPMSSQNRVFSSVATHSPQQPVNVTPSTDTQYVITRPTTIARRNFVRLASVLLGFALALVFSSMSLAQDSVKADSEAF